MRFRQVACRNVHSIREPSAILCKCCTVGIVEELCRNPSFSPVSDTGELDSILAVLRYNTWRAAWAGPFLITLFAIDKASNLSLVDLRGRSVGIIHVPHVQ